MKKKTQTQLVQYNKKFLIIGNVNAITFKEIFPLIKENKIWLGVTKVHEFIQPDGSIKKFGNICWFTNIDHQRRHEPLDLYRKYSNESYPKYDNYDAIECSKVVDIPMDYDGVIGVPITFLDKYCPEQFEIIDINPHFFSMVSQGLPKPKQLTLHNVGKSDPYARILIKRK